MFIFVMIRPDFRRNLTKHEKGANSEPTLRQSLAINPATGHFPVNFRNQPKINLEF